MPNKKGFTLTELIVVMTIVGITASVGIFNYNIMIIQGAAKAARNNLITIYNAEQTYYLNNGQYCFTTLSGCPDSATSCCDSLANINNDLSLSITDNYFTYNCFHTNSAYLFQCQAHATSLGNLTLTISNQPIVLPGGKDCPSTSTGCNPTCYGSNVAYCP